MNLRPLGALGAVPRMRDLGAVARLAPRGKRETRFRGQRHAAPSSARGTRVVHGAKAHSF